MNKKDITLGFVIGASVGFLVQPMLSTLGESLSGAGIQINLVARVLAFLLFTALAPALVFLASLVGKFLPVAYQFSKFAAVGTLNSFIDFGVVNVLILISGHAAGVWFAGFKSISFLFAATNSFFWNKLWTFDSKEGNTAAQAIKFYIITG